MTTQKKKLIEVALPLEAINKASAKEKTIRHGHPSTFHLWWARRPLAAARAIVFAQMVDDPSGHPDLFPTKKAQDKERKRLFAIIEQLVQWENITNANVLKSASDAIWQSWRSTCAENVDHPRAKELFDRHVLPTFHDPFAGGGAIPLEAQRLGLVSHASDLNPVAVLINKAMIEVPSKFAGRAPVHPSIRTDRALVERAWERAQGLAEDVRRYGTWMQEEAHRRIGHLYPPVTIAPSVVAERPDLKGLLGDELTVVAWIWARTVRSPNPAFSSIHVPLASTFYVSTQAGREAFVKPELGKSGYRFTVRPGQSSDETTQNGTKLGRGSNFFCLMSRAPISGDYIKAEAKAGRMSARMMAVVAEGPRGRVYLSPTPEMEEAAQSVKPEWRPDTPLVGKCRDQVPLYGMETFGDIFTDRQLVALTTFSDIVLDARAKVRRDAVEAGMAEAGGPLASGGTGAEAYADAVTTILAFVASKLADRLSSLCSWNLRAGQGRRSDVRNLFARQAIPMTWDFAEANPLSGISGSIETAVEKVSDVVDRLPAAVPGHVAQRDAAQMGGASGCVVSTDPPYYDNISYADLSDYFYVWLRRSLRPVYPELLSTVAVPKLEELVATPHRHGSRESAEAFFLDGMSRAMHRLAVQAHPAFPVTIYYAFKQSEGESEGVASTGWETFLDAVIRAGFAITGTWPTRTEAANRLIGKDANALASSIVLVCRPREASSKTVSRREYIQALKAELPDALADLQRGNIAPVDLAQASIGPGMAVFTRFERVLDAEGKPVPVREALALINQTLDEALANQEGDFDSDSRWALAWFEQSGFAEGEYGVAETLSKAKNTSVKGLEEAGILKSSRGKVRLLKASELPADWDPRSDERLTAWEVVHHLIRALDAGGELGAATLVAQLGAKAEVARELAYRLYSLCERKKRAAEAASYNGLVLSWPEIARLAREGIKSQRPAQGGLFDKDEG